MLPVSFAFPLAPTEEMESKSLSEKVAEFHTIRAGPQNSAMSDDISCSVAYVSKSRITAKS